MSGSNDPNNKTPRLDKKPPLLMNRRFFYLSGFLVPKPKGQHTMNQTPTPSIRIFAENPDHHLWNNHGTFWCHYTLHFPDYTKRRIRQNLGTSCRKRARLLRNRILANPSAAANTHSRKEAA